MLSGIVSSNGDCSEGSHELLKMFVCWLILDISCHVMCHKCSNKIDSKWSWCFKVLPNGLSTSYHAGGLMVKNIFSRKGLPLQPPAGVLCRRMMEM